MIKQETNKLLVYAIILGFSLAILNNYFVDDAEAKKSKSEREMEKMQECALENLEKTQEAAKQGNIYVGNPDCDKDNQDRYDRINENTKEINENAKQSFINFYHFIINLYSLKYTYKK